MPWGIPTRKRYTLFSAYWVSDRAKLDRKINLPRIEVKQPRPSGFLDKNDGGNYTATEQYGMPSGHSSAVWYCFTYLWLIKPTNCLLLIDLAICLNTMYQRWAFKKHTIGQLAVGMLIGGGVAWLSVAVTRHVLKQISSKTIFNYV